MLLTEPPRLSGRPSSEIQSLVAAFGIRAEKVIIRCEELTNPVTSLRTQNFAVSVNCFNEPVFILETVWDD
jgi:hypothetical protein